MTDNHILLLCERGHKYKMRPKKIYCIVNVQMFRYDIYTNTTTQTFSPGGPGMPIPAAPGSPLSPLGPSEPLDPG